MFGADPLTFDKARLGYPERIYEILRQRCAVRSGANVFEIGGGTGIATRDLLSLHPRSLTVIEPNKLLARYLVRTLGRRHATVKLLV